jgi:hypothetical protein
LGGSFRLALDVAGRAVRVEQAAVCNFEMWFFFAHLVAHIRGSGLSNCAAYTSVEIYGLGVT